MKNYYPIAAVVSVIVAMLLSAYTHTAAHFALGGGTEIFTDRGFWYFAARTWFLTTVACVTSAWASFWLVSRNSDDN